MQTPLPAAMAAAPAPVPEVQAYTDPESTDEVQQSSLAALVSRMQAGSPSPRDLVSAVKGRQRVRLPSASPDNLQRSFPGCLRKFRYDNHSG